ncbi:MAG: ABC transporter substrate-binding protein [Alphaproteobacteria bacterium]|nr:ABC transporter substrate-binding protein [Alphaproteobacteria bacterium]MCZ6740728.1 ABC transporter substrate-binding protein [Alphaproteobacteria bacterium]
MKPVPGKTRGLGRRGATVLAGILLSLSLAHGPAGAGDPPKPRRIASLNVCTDQLLLLLGLRARLVSVTFLAADPSSSAMPEAVRGLNLNRGRAEEILPLRPDLVLAGSTAATPTVQLLRRLGHRVVVVPLATKLDDIPRNIETVARATGEEARGRKLIAEFRNELKRITAGHAAARKGPKPSAMLFGPNGVTSGAHSLAGAVIRAAGFTNSMAALGLAGVGRVPLETVLASRPRLLILSSLKRAHPSLASGLLAHPALGRVFAGRAVIRIHHHVWACGTPLVLGAIRRLALVRARLARQGRAIRP